MGGNVTRAEQLSRESEPTTYNILFVCTGNTCRSPMAEVIMRRKLEERRWENVATGSAGIAAVVGEPAAGNAITVANDEGLNLEGHGARLLTHDLVDWADLILVMSPSHLKGVELMGGGQKTALVTEFEEGAASQGEPVEDPFGASLDAYRRTFRRLEEAISAVLDKIEPIIAP